MMTAKMSDKDTREDINKVFNLFDDDQTGHITLRNLKRVAKELGETMSGERGGGGGEGCVGDDCEGVCAPPPRDVHVDFLE